MIDCAYKRPESRTSSLLIAAYVMAGICGICVIPLVIMIAQWVHIKVRQRSPAADESNIETADINNLLPEANGEVSEGSNRWPSTGDEETEGQGQLTRSTQSEF